MATCTDIPLILLAIELDRANSGVEREKFLAKALQVHPAVLIFPGWDVEQKEVAWSGMGVVLIDS